jgi:hypothetical protein
MLQWKKQLTIHITRPRVCSLMYQACSAHAPYCHLCPAGLYSIFPHYLTKNTVFEKKKIIEHKMWVFILSTVLSQTLPILRRPERDMIKNVYWAPCQLPVIFARFVWILNFLDTFSWNSKDIRSREIPYSASGIVPCRRTDRHDETKGRFSQMGERT